MRWLEVGETKISLNQPCVIYSCPKLDLSGLLKIQRKLPIRTFIAQRTKWELDETLKSLGTHLSPSHTHLWSISYVEIHCRTRLTRGWSFADRKEVVPGPLQKPHSVPTLRSCEGTKSNALVRQTLSVLCYLIPSRKKKMEKIWWNRNMEVCDVSVFSISQRQNSSLSHFHHLPLERNGAAQWHEAQFVNTWKTCRSTGRQYWAPQPITRKCHSWGIPPQGNITC